MTAMLKMVAAVMVVVVPGGLLMLAAFVLARIVAEKLKTIEGGPDRLKRVVADLKFRDVWDEARRSL